MVSVFTKASSICRRAWPGLPLVLLGFALAGRSVAEADASTGMRGYELFEGRYASFCCQSGGPAPGTSAAGTLRFAPCFETRDTADARRCRQQQLYFYPVAVRTDRTFTFDNESLELVIFPR